MELPNSITFQWHITDSCNLRCQHCYQEQYSNMGLPMGKLLQQLDQIEAFVRAAKMQHDTVRAHINFTGGEPFTRPDFMELLQETQRRQICSIGILSNGLLPSAELLAKLGELHIRFIQLSVEGSQSTNDSIRGKGSTAQVELATKTYRKLGIPVIYSFTANAKNFTEFADVVKFARKNKAHKVWTDRYLPDSTNDQLQLSPQQANAFFHSLKQEQDKSKRHIFSHTKVSAHRALQFLVSGGKPYQCTAGQSLITIMPDGTLYPCRRLPIAIGNMQHDNLMDVYLNNPTLHELRSPSLLESACGSCHYKTACNGGLRCLGFAVAKKIGVKDPDCWL